MSCCLALDVGDERIGVAVSDGSGVLARPLETVQRVRGSASFERIAALAHSYGAEYIVIGLPLLPDGGEGKQVASTRAYVRGLQVYLEIPIILWDERDSSNIARSILAQSERGPKRQRRDVDAVAAAVILQDYLDQHQEDAHHA